MMNTEMCLSVETGALTVFMNLAMHSYAGMDAVISSFFAHVTNTRARLP